MFGVCVTKQDVCGRVVVNVGLIVVSLGDWLLGLGDFADINGGCTSTRGQTVVQTLELVAEII